MFLYKFLPERYLSDFFEFGSLRLGSIHGFRDIISHTSARGDGSEGKNTIFRHISNEFHLTKDTNEPLISDVFKGPSDGYSTLSNILILSPRNSENGYIFCTSNSYSDELFRRWNLDSNENDSCYVILNPKMFFHEITEVIKNSIFSSINRNITYTTNPLPYNDESAKIEPYFTKESDKYSWQKENRNVWGVKGPTPKFEYWNIKAPNAVKYCRPYRKIKDGYVLPLLS